MLLLLPPPLLLLPPTSYLFMAREKALAGPIISGIEHDGACRRASFAPDIIRIKKEIEMATELQNVNELVRPRYSSAVPKDMH